MTDDPTPKDDEDWTLNDDQNQEDLEDVDQTLEEGESLEQAGESLEDAGQSLEDAGEASSDYSGGDAGEEGRLAELKQRINGDMDRRDFAKGLGAGILGAGLIGAGIYASDRVDVPGIADGQPGDQSAYELSDEVTVDIDALDSIYEDSSVIMGVHEDGDLVAWNPNVQTGEGNNPLWRFPSEDFPDTEYFDVEGDHPVTEIYNASDADVETMEDNMVEVFYNASEDGGSLQDEASYKEVDFTELKDGLLEYGGSGPAQDYFFNRQETLDAGQPVLEQEWQELLQDGQ